MSTGSLFQIFHNPNQSSRLKQDSFLFLRKFVNMKLSLQLEAALKQAQELAVKAIEGTSSHGSFEALKEIALEQAKNQPKAK